MNSKRKMARLSEDGKDWLISCLDPFHDYQQTLRGYPDLVSSPSVVQMHNGTLDVTAPGAGSWDCSVCFTGFDTVSGVNLPLYGGTTSGYTAPYDSTLAVSTTLLKSLTVTSVAAGGSLALTNAAAVKTGLDSRYSGERGRLIAVAYEVHNTTAEVYKQGSVLTATLQDAAVDNANCIWVDTSGTHGNHPAQQDSSAQLPTSVEHLRRVPSCGTWDAKKGVYCIPRLSRQEPVVSEAENLHRTTRMVYSDGTAIRTGWDGVNTVVGAQTFGKIRGSVRTAFTPAMTIFSGLSPETTLRVTFRTIVEYFPDTSSALLYGATPSSPYDPVALQIYSLTAQNAPYAVPVNQNSAGEYFRKVLSVLRQVAPYVVTVLPPHLKPLGMAASGGLVALDEYVKGREKEKVRRDEAGSRARPIRK